jgi:acetyl-CoA carboxylase carboxyl transferase subunit alpha
MGRVSTNNVGLAYTVESALGVPGTSWVQLEPNDITSFGATISKVARNPISARRDRRKGVVTDLDSAVEFEADLTASAFTDFVELHGDRAFREDAAIVGGWARLDGETVMVIGHQRGRDTKENIRRNFGMPHPEGYRKALRLMKLAEKFQVPVITLIDTPGAWAGLGAEERGQSEAIARNLFEMSQLQVPILATVIGEGGSGGALALGVADRVFLFENAVYSVITVEGCAAILWKDGKSPEMREKAASALKITAQDLFDLRVIDEIIAEPAGAAHSNHDATAAALRETLVRHLDELRKLKPERLIRKRREKFMRMGQFIE